MRDTRIPRRHPPPRPRLRRSSPAPVGGVGSAWRYQGSSRARGVAGEQPCPALLQDLPVHWTVGISPRGVGLTGRGNSFPLPCLLRSKYLTSPAPPTPPAPSALLPRPLPGAWAVRGDIKGAAVSGVQPVGHHARFFSRISPCAGPWWISPRGVGPTGRGNEFPLPCL